MAVGQYKIYMAGEVLTAADFNASLANITDNGQDIPFPRTEAADFDGYELILDDDADSSITADTDDRIDFRLRGVDLFRMDGATGGATINGFDFIAGATGVAPRISAQGSDSNIGINLVPKGTGAIEINGASLLGIRELPIPAASLSPTISAGCAPLAQVTLGSVDVMSLDFDGATGESAIVAFSLPKSWDRGTVKARFHYRVAAAVTTTVTWGIRALAVGDGDTVQTIYGTPQEVTDTYLGTANLEAITDFTPAVTIAGSPAAGDLLHFYITRNPGTDTTSQDARLEQVVIQYTVNAPNDA